MTRMRTRIKMKRISKRKLNAGIEQFFGKSNIDIREIKSEFPEAAISLVLALDFDTDLFKNIVYEYNFGGGAYGVYDPSTNLKVKEDLLKALRYRHKEVEEIDKNVFGVSFGINMRKIKQTAKQKFQGISQELETGSDLKGVKDLWKALAVIETAATMVHEAIHATDPKFKEPAAEQGERKFLNWLTKKDRVEKILADLQIDSSFADLIRKLYV